MTAREIPDAAAPVDLFAQQARNRRRARWVVAGFVLFFAWLGFGGDWIAWMATRQAEPGHYRHVVPWLGIGLSLVAAAIATWSVRTGAARVLWSTGARELLEAETPAERQLANIVEEMAIASGLPRPRIWIVPDADPNAFATGRDEQSAHIAVTEGLLAQLDRAELQGVIAHEFGHIRNLDVRLTTLLAALVGAVALIGDGMWRMMGGGGRLGLAAGRGGRKRDGNPLLLAALVLWVISWILAPVILRLLALGVSRSREYLADAMSAQYTRNPLALASALDKIEHAVEPTRSIKRGSAHLCIADPTGRRSSAAGWLTGAFATHPPMALRVARLRAMGYRSTHG
jgi:heat shock protein HtpX